MWPEPLKDMASFFFFFNIWESSQEVIQAYAFIIFGNYYIIAGDCVISIALYLNSYQIM